jgi:two-component system, NtrC family, sensor kinase
MTDATILIVDDDRSIVRLCQRLLERASFKVFASTDPLEAIKILTAHRVDLLLSDIRMPVMDGFELIERAKDLQPDLAVLVMTGFGTVDTAIQALYKGVDGLILKPFENTADLVKAVERVLAEIRQKQDAAKAQILRPLFDVTETLLAETNPQVLKDLILHSLLGLFHAQHAGVFNHNKESYDLVLGQGLPQEGVEAGWSYLNQFIAQCETLTILNSTGPGDIELQTAMQELGWSALLIAPVVRDNAAFIFFSARDAEGMLFSESDLELFSILARQSAIAMENARLYTDLRSYVQRIEESQHALVQAEKMAAVGRLMASLAHEINNPLQAVRNCLHLANRPDIDDKQRAVYLALTDNELDRLVKTVRHMLDFYRPGQREKEPLDLNGAVERVVHLLQAQMDTQMIRCHISIGDHIPLVFGVRDQIQQVFFNLILNSMDAMENVPDNRNIWVEAEVCESEVCIYVEDSGPGIPQEMREKLFEPFASSKINGTGLGLAVSYGVVEAHGGRLELAESRHGQGACFQIHFPIAKGG